MMTPRLSLEETAVALREGGLKAVELIEHAQANYDRHEPNTNAFKTWNGLAAARQAQAVDLLIDSGVDLGALMGVPVSVKDLFGVPGMPVFAGSDSALPPAYSQAGPVVKSVTGQLGIITGKTHTVEFAFGGLGVNNHWGTPVNPWSTDGHRVPGGSSSGAGVSLLQGTALLALGTDTAGSVRVPAAFTGQVGLKTTIGRWSGQHIVPLSFSLDTPGLLAGSVEDVDYAFRAMEAAMSATPMATRAEAELSAIRIGVPTNFFWEDTEASIAALVDEAITKLAGSARSVRRLELARCDEGFAVFRAGGLAAPELSQYMQAHFPEKIERLDPVVRMRVAGAEQVSSVEYLRRKAALAQYGREAEGVFSERDVLVTPTVAIPPPLLSELDKTEEYGRLNMLTLRNTVIANLFGWCALTLPVGKDKYGMPVGLQVMAPPHAESRLLAICLAFEACLGKPKEVLGHAPT